MLLAFITNRCRSRHDAAELAQETWLRVWKSVSTQFDGTDFRAWLYRIARNLMVDHYRRKVPQPLAVLPEPEPPAEPDFVDAPSDTAVALAGCLEQLSGEHMTIVRARLKGEGYETISQRLGIPQNTAMTRFHRAKQQLQDCVSRKLS